MLIDIDAPALLMLQEDDNPEFSLHRLMRMGIRKAFDALMLLSGFAEVPLTTRNRGRNPITSGYGRNHPCAGLEEFLRRGWRMFPVKH